MSKLDKKIQKAVRKLQTAMDVQPSVEVQTPKSATPLSDALRSMLAGNTSSVVIPMPNIDMAMSELRGLAESGELMVGRDSVRNDCVQRGFNEQQTTVTLAARDISELGSKLLFKTKDAFTAMRDNGATAEEGKAILGEIIADHIETITGVFARLYTEADSAQETQEENHGS